MSFRSATRWAWATLLVLLAACSARPRPEIDERSLGEAPPAPVVRVPEYTVGRGDTLYGIAFRLGVDYREFARWNHVPAPYTIYPGQKLKVEPPADLASTAPPRPREEHRRRREHGSGVVASTAASTSPTAATTGGRAVASRPATRASPDRSKPPTSNTRSPASTAAADHAKPKPSVTSSTGAGGVRWQWPVRGELLARFSASDPTLQGVDIAGKGGEPVKAAADGEVVYSGAGLVGYGELIIVKHNDTWLSAYGHNRKRLVNEGQKVSAGQTIAELGRTGASRDMLHFEIRRNGKPVDPLGILPSP